MKLAICAHVALAAFLGLGAVASADPEPYAGPPGAMQPRPDRPGRADRPGRPGRGQRGEIRRALLDRFDQNHDGRLEPQERRQAIRALRKLTRRLARQQMRKARQVRGERKVIEKYDANGDGDVGPGEMPPGLAHKMQPLDRNGDGWLDDSDQ